MSLSSRASSTTTRPRGGLMFPMVGRAKIITMPTTRQRIPKTPDHCNFVSQLSKKTKEAKQSTGWNNPLLSEESERNQSWEWGSISHCEWVSRRIPLVPQWRELCPLPMEDRQSSGVGQVLYDALTLYRRAHAGYKTRREKSPHKAVNPAEV